MAAVIPFIPLIVGGISAGATAYGAHKASEANQQAADAQSKAATTGSADQLKAAEEALAFQKQQYNNTQKAINPYQNMGLGALSALGSGLGVTPGNLPVNQIAPDRQNGMTTSGFMSPEDFTQFKGAVVANANERPANTFANVGNGAFGVQADQAQRAQSLSQSSVRLQSPDGKDVQDVPASQAQYFISKGAKVVSA